MNKQDVKTDKNTDKMTDRMTDKAFSRLVLTSVIAILCCMVFMCSATWAWFTASVQNANNSMKTNECLIQASVSKLDGTVVAVADIYKSESVELELGSYNVTITLPGGSASGYVVVTTDNGKYLTDYIVGNRQEDITEELVLKVEAADSPITVTFTARWGIYSADSDVADGVLVIN